MDKIIRQAEELFGKCAVANIATVDAEGYPRPVPMAVIAHEGIRTVWFATGESSAKTAHIEAMPKAGVSFWNEGDSVVLTGTAEVIRDAASKHKYWQDWFRNHFEGGVDDPEYVLIKFTARQASIYIGGEFVRCEVE